MCSGRSVDQFMPRSLPCRFSFTKKSGQAIHKVACSALFTRCDEATLKIPISRSRCSSSPTFPPGHLQATDISTRYSNQHCTMRYLPTYLVYSYMMFPAAQPLGAETGPHQQAGKISGGHVSMFHLHLHDILIITWS